MTIVPVPATTATPHHKRAALIASNVLPLFGALFLGWTPMLILGLYWAENVVIGLINALKMLTCTGHGGDSAKSDGGSPSTDAAGAPFPWPARLFLTGFFLVHYGIFTFVHGMFVLFLGEAAEQSGSGAYGSLADHSPWLIGLSLLVMAGSHLYSFVADFLLEGLGRDADVAQIMFLPYPRMVVLHVTIIFGAMALMALGSPVFLVAILVVLKTILDLWLEGHAFKLR